MKRHLFLTGPSGCGKSTMIRNALGRRMACAGGFVTERVQNADGSLAGFDLYPAAAVSGVEGFCGRRFLNYSTVPPTKDNEVFRNDAVQLLQEAVFYPFSVIDEFGGFEILIPQFRAALSDFLSSEQPCIGVLKGAANSEELRRRFGLGEKFSDYTALLLRALENDADTEIITVTDRYDESALSAVRKWVEEYADIV